METTNHEYYVSLEVAKLLKEAGFDWEIYDGYIIYENGDGFTTEFQTPHNFNGDNGDLFINYRGHKEVLSRPTLDVAQRWLREIRHRSIEVKSFVDGTVDNRGKWWIWHMYDFNPPIDWVLLMSSDCRYSTYEEAQEAGIKKALEIILEKGK